MPLDRSAVREAFAAPGMDTRIWVAVGTVVPETDDQKSVYFNDTAGNPLAYPVVLVQLGHTDGVLPCRVAASVAGDGEGEWVPFVEGDEVLVVIPGGDERELGVILGRLNQSLDKFPTLCGGMDTTQNNFGFRRMLTPYVLESAKGILLRQATAGSFLSLDPTGNAILVDGDGHALHVGSDWVGLMLADNSAVIQAIPAAGANHSQLFLQANGLQWLMDDKASTFLTPGTLAIGTSGTGAGGHAVTMEQVLCIISNVICQLATVGAFNPTSPFGSAWSSTAPVPLTTMWAAVIPGCVAPSPVGSGGAPGGVLDALALTPLILTALLGQLPDPASLGLPSPVLPGIGKPGLKF
jgi:hypothetical protein